LSAFFQIVFKNFNEQVKAKHGYFYTGAKSIADHVVLVVISAHVGGKRRKQKVHFLPMGYKMPVDDAKKRNQYFFSFGIFLQTFFFLSGNSSWFIDAWCAHDFVIILRNYSRSRPTTLVKTFNIHVFDRNGPIFLL
jgi:hypothetical protein